jgi:hypothetical protein
MQDGGTGAGAQHGGAGREANLIFVLPPNVYVGPPVGGTFQFQIFIQTPSLEIWRKTISGAEGGSGEEVEWPILGYLLGKNFRRVIAIISFRPGGWMQQSAVPRCAILAVGSTGGIGQ